MSARVTFLVIVSILAFTANPLLARLAIVTREMDALGYTGVRLASGALVLLLIILMQHRRASGAPLRIAGTWAGAASLFVYAITYSVGFIVIGAAVGSVILFAAVQIAILAWAISRATGPARSNGPASRSRSPRSSILSRRGSWRPIRWAPR